MFGTCVLAVIICGRGGGEVVEIITFTYTSLETDGKSIRYSKKKKSLFN